MKTRNDCEIACDCVKRANVVLHVHKHTHNADLSFIFSLNSSLQCITLSLVFNMLTLYIYSLA